MPGKPYTIVCKPVDHGIECYGLRFASPDLTRLLDLIGSADPDLEVQLNPGDLRAVRVRDPCTGWTAMARNSDQIYGAMVDLTRHFEICRRLRFRALAAGLRAGCPTDGTGTSGPDPSPTD